MDKIFIIVWCRVYIGEPDEPWRYLSCFSSKELAEKECIILKHDDEASGDNFTKYKVLEESIRTELTPEDPGLV